jgi:non-homologous end joining protein Ku
MIKLFKSIPKLRVKKDMVELAAHILDRKAGHFRLLEPSAP